MQRNRIRQLRFPSKHLYNDKEDLFEQDTHNTIINNEIRNEINDNTAQETIFCSLKLYP